MQKTSAKEEEKKSRKADVLYCHTTRKEWGLALLAWDRGDKRGYQFEDGNLRAFKKGYFGLLEEVDVPPEEGAPVRAALRRRLGLKEQAITKKPKRPIESVPFEHQLELFRQLYPKGFQGSKWAREKRGIDATRGLQRYREVALTEARKLLCLSRLSKLRQGNDGRGIIEAIKELSDSTDLIPKSKLRALDQLSEQGSRLVGEHLFELLHGDGKLAIRFERFVDALARTTGKQPSWQLATVLLALFFPKEQVCVKVTTMRAQAACLGRRMTISTIPTAPMYERLRGMTIDVEQRLKAAGHHPRDLLDVYDFMETTLSPKAMKRIEAMRASSSTPTDERSVGERAAA